MVCFVLVVCWVGFRSLASPPSPCVAYFVIVCERQRGWFVCVCGPVFAHSPAPLRIMCLFRRRSQPWELCYVLGGRAEAGGAPCRPSLRAVLQVAFGVLVHHHARGGRVSRGPARGLDAGSQISARESEICPGSARTGCGARRGDRCGRFDAVFAGPRRLGFGSTILQSCSRG
jgi:hypothetical protein